MRNPFEAASEVDRAFTAQQIDIISAEIGRTSIVVDRRALEMVVGDIASAHNWGDAAAILKAWQAFDAVLGERRGDRREDAV